MEMNDPGMRYNRVLSPAFEDILTAGTTNSFSFLLHDALGAVEQTPYTLDIQIREDDKLMFYHGGTRILSVKYSPRKGSVPLSFVDTDKSYKNLREFANLQDAVNSKNRESLRTLYPQYIQAAIHHIDTTQPHWYQHEGYWQNKLCVDFGRYWEPSDRWLVLDREVVIGFDSKESGLKALAKIAQPYVDLVVSLRAEDAGRWGKLKKKAFGNGLDLLAISEHGALLLIELKHGTYQEGIYWGAYQVSVYNQLCEMAFGALVAGASALAEQKVRLGLLPESATSLIRKFAANGQELISVLAIAEPNPNSTCWEKLIEAAKRDPESNVSVTLIGSSTKTKHNQLKVQPRQVDMTELPGCI